jgi:hypothetical protein
VSPLQRSSLRQAWVARRVSSRVPSVSQVVLSLIIAKIQAFVVGISLSIVYVIMIFRRFSVSTAASPTGSPLRPSSTTSISGTQWPTYNYRTSQIELCGAGPLMANTPPSQRIPCCTQAPHLSPATSSSENLGAIESQDLPVARPQRQALD